MVNWKKAFLFVGIPLLAFYVFLIIIYFAFISGLLLAVLILGCACLRKRKFWPGLTKLSIVMVLFFLLLVPNPLIWPQQIARHLDVGNLVTPDHESIQQLYSDYMDHVNQSCGLDYFHTNMTDDDRLQNMTTYCELQINWTLIMEQYGVIDYVATPEEVLDAGMGDCQARTVVMVSMFMYAGYDAYCCECPFHWFPCVYLNETAHYYYIKGYAPSDIECMFNNETVIYTKNVVERLGHIVFHPKFAAKLQEMFESPTTMILLPVILIGLGFLMPLVIESTNWKSKRNYLKNAAFCAVILVVGFFAAFGVSLAVPELILIILLSTIAVAAQSVHSNLGVRLFSKGA